MRDGVTRPPFILRACLREATGQTRVSLYAQASGDNGLVKLAEFGSGDCPLHRPTNVHRNKQRFRFEVNAAQKFSTPDVVGRLGLAAARLFPFTNSRQLRESTCNLKIRGCTKESIIKKEANPPGRERGEVGGSYEQMCARKCRAE